LINDAPREHLRKLGLAEQVGAEVRTVLRQELGKIKAIV